MSSTRLRVITTLLLLATPAQVHAQAGIDSLRADSAAQRLNTVGVSASSSAGVIGGAAAIVVKPSELRSSPAPLLDQVLRESPFVLVRQNSRGEMEISIRGSDSRQAAVILDGVPLTLGWDHRTDPSVLPVTGSERIEIVRGLGSLLKGPNTLGGSIEITHDPFGQPASGRMWAGLGVDQFGSTVTTLGYGGRLAEFGGGALSLRAGGAHRQRDGVALPDDATDPTAQDGLRTGTDMKELDGFASLRWNARNGASFGFMYSAFDAERGVPPEEHIASPRLWRYPYVRRQVATVSGSTGTFKTPLGHGSFEAGLGLNDGNLKIDAYSDRTYTTITTSELGDEKTTTARAMLTHSVGSATLRIGYTGADIKYIETLPPAEAANYRQKLSSTGAELDVPVGGRTALSGGIVFDGSTTPETGGRTPAQEPLDNTGWRFGAKHELTDRVLLHASASQRSRFPALRELYSGALNRFRPNPDLKPETLLGFEGGFTIERTVAGFAQSNLQLIGFKHRMDDAVVRITLSNPTRFMRVNRDRIESAGIEFLGGFVFGDNPDRDVSLNGDATLQRITIYDETDNDAQRHAENNPEQRARLELGVPLPVKLRAIAAARYTGTQYCLNADTGNEDQVKAATVGDVMVQRDFSMSSSGPFRMLRGLMGFSNVGNTAVYDQCGLTQPGRTFRVSMSIR